MRMGANRLARPTALWFYRLFRTVDAFSAAAIVVFGLVNSIAILGSAAFLARPLDVATSPAGGRPVTPS